MLWGSFFAVCTVVFHSFYYLVLLNFIVHVRLRNDYTLNLIESRPVLNTIFSKSKQPCELFFAM